jgi:hypothetical protein
MRVHDPSRVATHGVALWSAGQSAFSRPPPQPRLCESVTVTDIGRPDVEGTIRAALQAEPIGAGARCHRRRRNHPRPRTAPAPAVWTWRSEPHPPPISAGACAFRPTWSPRCRRYGREFIQPMQPSSQSASQSSGGRSCAHHCRASGGRHNEPHRHRRGARRARRPYASRQRSLARGAGPTPAREVGGMRVEMAPPQMTSAEFAQRCARAVRKGRQLRRPPMPSRDFLSIGDVKAAQDPVRCHLYSAMSFALCYRLGVSVRE